MTEGKGKLYRLIYTPFLHDCEGRGIAVFCESHFALRMHFITVVYLTWRQDCCFCGNGVVLYNGI